MRSLWVPLLGLFLWQACAPKRPAARPMGGDQAVYRRYGCVYCHGETGAAEADLTGANRDFPTDAALKRFLEDPSKMLGRSLMPAGSGRIREEDYPALIRAVRALSRQVHRPPGRTGPVSVHSRP